jgi:hypothetical protein
MVETLPPLDIYGYTIFCDDIRQEVGGKYSYIGAYDGKMFVQGDFPVLLSKLCLAVTFLQRRELLIANVGLHIFGPEQTEVDTPSIQATFQEPEEGAVAKQTAAASAAEGLPGGQTSYVAMLARIILSPFNIAQPGDLRVRILRDGKYVRAGALRIFQVPKA